MPNTLMRWRRGQGGAARDRVPIRQGLRRRLRSRLVSNGLQRRARCGSQALLSGRITISIDWRVRKEPTSHDLKDASKPVLRAVSRQVWKTEVTLSDHVAEPHKKVELLCRTCRRRSCRSTAGTAINRHLGPRAHQYSKLQSRRGDCRGHQRPAHAAGSPATVARLSIGAAGDDEREQVLHGRAGAPEGDAKKSRLAEAPRPNVIGIPTWSGIHEIQLPAKGDIPQVRRLPTFLETLGRPCRSCRAMSCPAPLQNGYARRRRLHGRTLSRQSRRRAG